MGKKRIIEECAVCRRHGVIPWSQWKLAEGRMEQAIDEYRASPRDRDKAIEALKAIASFRNLPKLQELAPAIESNLPRDGKLLCTLAAVWDSFGNLGEYERLLKQARAVEDSEDVREAVADSLMRQNRPEEAEPYLQHIVAKGIPDRVDSLYQLAQAYQSQGNHEKAMEVFAQCEIINPNISSDATFRRLREASAMKLGTRSPVRAGDVLRKAKSQDQWRKFAKVAPIVVILAIVCYMALSFVMGLRTPVYVVNGLNRIYAVQLNGTRYELPPEQAVKVRISQGNLKIEFTDLGASAQPKTVKINTPFWSRPFTSRAVVVNPDETAVIDRGEFFYVPHGSTSGHTPSHDLVGGKVIHEFDDIDYPFEEPPKTLQTESSSGSISKHYLDVIGRKTGMTPDMLIVGLSTTLGKETAIHMAKQHLLLEPEQFVYIKALERLMPYKDLADFLRPGLSHKPLLMPWHREYQSMMGECALDEQVEKEYDELLAKDPNNNELVYLSGRAAIDMEKYVRLIKQSADHDPPAPYAFYSLCGYSMAQADFHQAAEYAGRAIELLPNEPEVRSYCKTALIADAQYDRVIKLDAADQAGPMPNAIAAFHEELYIRRLKNQPSEAADVVPRLRNRMKKWDPEGEQKEADSLEAAQDYILGRPNAYVKVMRTASDAESQMCGMLAAEDVKSAEAKLSEVKPHSYWHVMLYLSAVKTRKADVAQRQLAKAIEMLSKGDYEDRCYAATLSGKPMLPLDKLLRMRGQPVQKAAMLIVIGLNDPAAREQCFSLARKLNFDKRFPYLTLAAILDTGQTK
jgi:tetratricopeptide (TPR) repeat protein